MIHVNFKISSELDCIIGFKVLGHAFYDESGKDIVCLACSILTINTINSLENLLKIEYKLKQDEEKGRMIFDLKNKGDYTNHDVQLLLASYRLGISTIAKEYPKHLTISTEEV